MDLEQGKQKPKGKNLLHSVLTLVNVLMAFFFFFACKPRLYDRITLGTVFVVESHILDNSRQGLAGILFRLVGAAT